MSKWPDPLRDKGKADEDLYFAERDRELQRALRHTNPPRGSIPASPERDRRDRDPTDTPARKSPSD